MRKFEISGRRVGENEPVFIVAEIGINHNGSVRRAKEMADKAFSSGADAVKFQTFRADSFISDPKAVYTYRSRGKKVTEPMLEMFGRLEFKRDEWKELLSYCSQRRIPFFSTPQDKEDLDFLMSITGLSAIKVGSDDLTNTELLSYYASKNKPVILSAGMAYRDEIRRAVRAVRKTGNDRLAVLHCVSSYPADAGEINMRKMRRIKDELGVITGFSDHTAGFEAALVATAMGASIVEKHFTLDRSLEGPDHWFSADPAEFALMTRKIRLAEKMMGRPDAGPSRKEMSMRRIARRSIVAAADLEKGRRLKKSDLVYKRPGTGLAPYRAGELTGKTVKTKIRKGEILSFKKIEV